MCAGARGQRLLSVTGFITDSALNSPSSRLSSAHGAHGEGPAILQGRRRSACPRNESARPTVRLTHFRYGTRTQRMGASPMIGHMEWTFTGEVIEWRGPAPYSSWP